MDVSTERLGIGGCVRPIWRGLQEKRPAASREDWTREYAGRILKHFTRWQTPLGVAPAYIGRLREDLTSFYDDPLKRMFIEATYSGS